MEFNKEKYDLNEKLVLRVAWILILASIALFALTILLIEGADFLISTIELLAVIGMVSSAIVVITANVRVIRYFIIIRQNNLGTLIWKSGLAIFSGFLSFSIFYFVLLLIVIDSI